MREKSKLVKLRHKEKQETGNRTVFVGNVPVQAEKKVIAVLLLKYNDQMMFVLYNIYCVSGG